MSLTEHRPKPRKAEGLLCSSAMPPVRRGRARLAGGCRISSPLEEMINNLKKQLDVTQNVFRVRLWR